MDCVNCECTVKTMNNLEGAIKALMQRGKYVNRMMDNEKMIRETRKMEEIRELKKQMNHQKAASPAPAQKPSPDSGNLKMCRGEPTAEKPRRIYNKVMGAAETIDFDIPSLTYESSQSPPYTSASISIPKKTCSTSVYTETVAELTTATFKSSPKGGAIVLNGRYVVDKNGSLEELPMKVYVKQNLENGALDVQIVFFDEKSQKVMDVSMTVQNKKVRDVQFCGKDAKMIG